MHKSKMYACFAFFPDGSVKRWKYVSNLQSFGQFLSKSHPAWKYFNVYDKGSKAFAKRFYPSNVIPKVLPLFIAFLLAFSFEVLLQKPPYENTFNKTTIAEATCIYGFNNTATIPTLFTKKGGNQC
jgi:hypothetical protein